MRPCPSIDLLAPEVVVDPYLHLARLREADPVHWSAVHGAWIVTRYDDCSAGHTDARLSADRIGPYLARLIAEDAPAPLIATFRVLADWMVFKDAPDHTRLRRLVLHAFTPRAVERLRERIALIATSLLDDLEAGGRREADLVAAYAYPLPAIVIAELLGVPVVDRDRFKAWSDDILALVFGATGDPDRHDKASAGMGELVEYLSARIAEARVAPGDNLLSALVAAEEGGERLSEQELLATCTLILFGGHETTTNLIGSGLLALLRTPGEADRLRSAAPELERTAVEELLRFEGPAPVDIRVARESFELRGRQIEQGQCVFLMLAAANRDPERFDRPDELDLGRDPNPHIGFGLGRHYCVGAPLARLEAQIAIPAALRRFPGLELADGHTPSWQRVLLSRALHELPVTLFP